MSEFAGKLIIQNCKNSNLNCTQYMCRMSGFAEKLNTQNYENSTGNCVQYICMERKDLLKN